MGLLGFLPRFLSFFTPITRHLFPGLQAIGRERVHAALVPERIEAQKIFCHFWVWTLSAWVTDECFIHCALPLGLTKYNHNISCAAWCVFYCSYCSLQATIWPSYKCFSPLHKIDFAGYCCCLKWNAAVKITQQLLPLRLTSCWWGSREWIKQQRKIFTSKNGPVRLIFFRF